MSGSPPSPPACAQGSSQTAPGDLKKIPVPIYVHSVDPARSVLHFGSWGTKKTSLILQEFDSNKLESWKKSWVGTTKDQEIIFIGTLAGASYWNDVVMASVVLGTGTYAIWTKRFYPKFAIHTT